MNYFDCRVLGLARGVGSEVAHDGNLKDSAMEAVEYLACVIDRL